MALGILDEFDTFELIDADIVKGGDPDTVYTCRVVTPAVVRRIQKQSKRKRPTGRANVEEKDDELFVRLMVDYLIVDWRGVVNAKTKAPIGPDDIVQTSDGPEKARHVAIDSARYGAILEAAGGNRVIENDHSFRPAP